MKDSMLNMRHTLRQVTRVVESIEDQMNQMGKDMEYVIKQQEVISKVTTL